MKKHSGRRDEASGVNAEPASASRRQFLGYAGAGVLATVLPGCSASVSATPYGNTIAAAQTMIQSDLFADPQNLASISVALLKNGRIVWAEAFGKASMQTGAPATQDTRYNIGSVSKVLAGLAAVILQDRGLLDLDAPIVQYVKNFSMLSPEYTQITSRHLLSHTSGFSGSNYTNIMTFVPVPGYAQATMNVLADQHLKHLPGELAVYCNDGFTIFELVVAAVSGMSYVSFVEQNILAPLKMTNSGFLTTVQTSGNFAYPYDNGTTYGIEYLDAYASGGLSTTPSDMMNLAQMFIGQGTFQGTQIVSARGIAEMATNQAANLTIIPSPIWPCGLGWDSVADWTMESVGVAGWNKNGGTAFFVSDFFVLPQAQMAILVTGNKGYNPRKIAETILMNALAEDRTIGAVPPLVSTAMPPAATPPNVASLTGSYGNMQNPVQVLQNSDGTLALNRWDGHAWVALKQGATSYQYCSDGWWWSAANTADSYSFQSAVGTDAEGNPYNYVYLTQRTTRYGAGYISAAMPLAQKLPDLPQLDAAWSAHLQTAQWKVTNMSPQSVQMATTHSPPQYSLAQIPALPGYILFDNQPLVPLSDDRGGMVLKIPLNMGRDLYEIVFSTVNGVQTITANGMTMVPA
ncbi:MAG TPA: serine hydrolase domain-containing protein [Paraburkholderia sp.]|nr:serine hydrolase domain-containing protein [Paraburkholderia sp.]